LLIGELKEELKEYEKEILALAKSSPLQKTMKSYYVIVVRDRDGRIIDRREGKLRSLTTGFLWIVANMLGLYNLSFTVPGYPTLVTAGCSYNYASSKYLIILGSGTQAFSPTLTSLSAPIPGASINVSYNYNVTSSGVVQAIFYGVYGNNGSNAINVSEFGLQLTATPCNTSSSGNYLLTYDTLSTPVTVPSGGSISIAIVVNLPG